MREDSVRIRNETINLKDLDASGLFRYTFERHRLDYVRFSDLTVGHLGQIMSGRIADSQSIIAQFNQHARETRYLFQAFGRWR